MGRQESCCSPFHRCTMRKISCVYCVRSKLRNNQGKKLVLLEMSPEVLLLAPVFTGDIGEGETEVLVEEITKINCQELTVFAQEVKGT